MGRIRDRTKRPDGAFHMTKPTGITFALQGLCLLSALVMQAAAGDPQPRAKGIHDALPDPDGKAADVSRTVQVFILMGQSNMLEMGKVAGDKDGTLEHAVKIEGLYPFLVDDAGKWTIRPDVRNVAVMGSGGPGKTQVRVNDWMTVGGKIGVEQGIGHHLGNALEEPVLILKSAIGNRSLGWDLLPPGSPSYEFTDPKDGKTFVYAGHGQRVGERLGMWARLCRLQQSGQGLRGAAFGARQARTVVQQRLALPWKGMPPPLRKAQARGLKAPGCPQLARQCQIQLLGHHVV